jgi:hypothetical protein
MYSDRVVLHKDLDSDSPIAPRLRAAGLPFRPDINLFVERIEEYLQVAPAIRQLADPMVIALGKDLSVFDQVVDVSALPALIEKIRAHWERNGLRHASLGPPEFDAELIGDAGFVARLLSDASFEKLLSFYDEDYRLVASTSASLARRHHEQAHSRARTVQPRPAPLPPVRWALRAEIDNRWSKTGAGELQLGGIVVLAARAPTGTTLRLWVDDTEIPVSWGFPSPQAAKRYPRASNAGAARFRTGPAPTGNGRVRLEIHHGPSGQSACLVDATPLPPDASLSVDEVRRRLAAINPDTKPPAALHRSLRQALDVTPEQERGTHWHEISILLDARFRMNSGRAYRSLELLRTQYLSQGEAQSFENFWQELMVVLAPHTLSPHGYLPALAGVDATAVWESVKVIISELATLGYPALINSGTLLGAVRDGKLIGHDDDVDLAVVLRGTDATTIAREWVSLRRTMSDSMLIDESFEQKNQMHCKLRRAGGVSVDLFPAWIIEGRAYIWPHTFGTIAESELLPLASMTISGVTLPVPCRPESFLTSNYGATWNIPDPTFRFQWEDARRRFSDFIQAFQSVRKRA